MDQYLPLKHLNDHQKYQINSDQMILGRTLQKFGLHEPYQFNASNSDTAQISGDFQSYLYQIKAIDRKIQVNYNIGKSLEEYLIVNAQAKFIENNRWQGQ